MRIEEETTLGNGLREPPSSMQANVSERQEATAEQIRDLPHIVDCVPFVAWTVAVIGATERFGYYSTVVIWRKFWFGSLAH